MRAMILAAGRGQRLSPLTDTTPKPLIKVGQQTLIEYQLDALNNAGFQEIVINTGWLGQQLIDHLGSGKRYGVHIEYSIEPEDGLETGGGIRQALPLLGNSPFLVINADIFHQFDLSQLKNRALGDKLAHLVLIENPTFNPDGDFCVSNGLLKLKITGLPRTRGTSRQLKPRTFSGIGVYRKELFNECSAGKFPLAPLLRESAANGKVSAQFSTAPWFDAGTESRLDEINKFIRQPVQLADRL